MIHRWLYFCPNHQYYYRGYLNYKLHFYNLNTLCILQLRRIANWMISCAQKCNIYIQIIIIFNLSNHDIFHWIFSSAIHHSPISKWPHCCAVPSCYNAQGRFVNIYKWLYWQYCEWQCCTVRLFFFVWSVLVISGVSISTTFCNIL